MNLDVTILSAAFNGALRQGHITVNPCLAIEPLKNKPQRKGVFTPEQIAALLKNRQRRLERSDIARLLFGATSARLREPPMARCRSRLRHQDHSLSGAKDRRGDRDRRSSVVGRLFVDPAGSKSDDEYMFPTLAGRRASPLSKQFGELIDLANIERGVIRERTTKGGSQRVRTLVPQPEAFIFIDFGERWRHRRKAHGFVGHSTRDTHQKYTHHELERLRDAISVLPSLNSKPLIVGKRRLR